MAEATSPNLNIPVGAPNWMDLMTTEVDKCIEFYGELFGWVANDTPPEFQGYRFFTLNGKAIGGIMYNDPSFGGPNGFMYYLHTTDAEKTELRVKDAGGEVIMPTMKVEENGSFTVTKDPGGAVIGAWQPGTESGFGVLNEPGAPSHFELHTRDWERVIDFYKEAYDWTACDVIDTPGFRYATFGDAENPRAGIMDATDFLPDGMLAHWSVYIAVDDAQATVDKAIALGGSVVTDIDDTPYGKLATLNDPSGATIKIRG